MCVYVYIIKYVKENFWEKYKTEEKINTERQ